MGRLHYLGAACCVLLLTVSAAGQIRILNMHDTDMLAGGTSPHTPNYVRDAATALGANLTVVVTGGAFDTEFDTAGPWDIVIYSSWTSGSLQTSSLDRMVMQATAGRGVILNSWNAFLSGLPAHSFFTTTIPVTITGDYTTALTLYPWDSTHPVWTSPRTVMPTPLMGTTHPTWNRDGQYVDPVAPTIAVGGYAGPSPSATNAAILINAANTVIFNGFTPQQYPMTEGVDLYINEISFILGPSCSITMPAAGATVSGSVPVTFNASEPMSLPVTAFFEWSIDGGATWNPCTTASGSGHTNPTSPIPTPATAQGYVWDSLADGVGTVGIAVTDFRATVTTGSATGSCAVAVDVDNVVPPPVCSVTEPGSMVSGNVQFLVDTTSPSSPTVDYTFGYTIDGGATWIPATAATTSPLANPAIGASVGTTVFIWDSAGDMVGSSSLQPGVLLRVTADDGVSPIQGQCLSGQMDVDNTALCGSICGDCNLNMLGPDIVDALTAAQIAVLLIAPTTEQMGCCDVNATMSVDVVDALFMAQSAAGLSVTLSCL